MSETPDLVAAMAAKQMGLEQPAPAPGVQGGDTTKKTIAEDAIAKGSPKDEADAMEADAIMYEIDGRQLTPNQIKSTFERYRDLNFRNQEMGDLHKVAEIAGKMGLGKNPSEVARAFAAMLKGTQSQPTMGGDGDPDDGQTSALPEDDEMSRWEEDNASKLPPGYRDLHRNLKDFGTGQAQMMEMMRTAFAKSGEVASSAADTAVQARQDRQGLMQERIKHNLQATADKVGLEPEHAQDFMMFAGERGYTLDDFIDPRLLGSIMTDFKQNMAGPEMDRMRAIAQRRQAFTGNVNASPSGGSEPAPPDGSRLGSLVDGVLSKRL